jgi:hypothetical protein
MLISIAYLDRPSAVMRSVEASEGTYGTVSTPVYTKIKTVSADAGTRERRCQTAWSINFRACVFIHGCARFCFHVRMMSFSTCAEGSALQCFSFEKVYSRIHCLLRCTHRSVLSCCYLSRIVSPLRFIIDTMTSAASKRNTSSPLLIFTFTGFPLYIKIDTCIMQVLQDLSPLSASQAARHCYWFCRTVAPFLTDDNKGRGVSQADQHCYW